MVEQNIEGRRQAEIIHAMSGQRIKLFDNISSETYTKRQIFKDGQPLYNDTLRRHTDIKQTSSRQGAERRSKE
jgi:hypothetical protein